MGFDSREGLETFLRRVQICSGPGPEQILGLWGRETNYLPPTRVEVKNERVYKSNISFLNTPDRDNFPRTLNVVWKIMYVQVKLASKLTKY
jgi:hypothetical protein